MAPGNRVLSNLEDTVCGLLMGAMTVIVFCAVVLRYAFNNPIGWSDELAKICFTWLVFLGGALGLKRGAHISIDALVQMLPGKLRKLVAAAADVLVLVLLLVIVYYGALIAAMTAGVTTPSLGVPVAVVYAAAPVSALVMTVHQLRRMFSSYYGARSAGPARQEAEG